MKLIAISDEEYKKIFGSFLKLRQISYLIVDIQKSSIDCVKNRWGRPGKTTSTELKKSIKQLVDMEKEK
jgi:hypothetical protein